MDRVIVRQRFNSQAITPPIARTIAFRHPGYTGDDELFKLPRLDSSPRTGEAAGVHHSTALLACQIIANNAFDGYLTTDRDGNHRVSPAVAPDGVLLEDDYWFHVPADGQKDDGVYPVVPRFEEWRFPHSHMGSLTWDPRTPAQARREPQTNVPDPTTPSTTPSAAPSVNPSLTPLAPPPCRRCILTNSAYATQRAHIVPTGQARWFLENNMKRYGAERLFIHAEQNKVSLRQDFHKLWDDFVFALVPKEGGRNFVVQMLGIPSSAASEFACEWHNRPTQEGSLDGVQTAFLFAKFAQAVFMLFKPFVAFPSERRYVVTCQTGADDKVEVKTVWLSISALNQKYSGGGSRSASVSSEERSQSQISEEEAEGDGHVKKRPRMWSSVLDSEEEDEDDLFERNLAGLNELGGADHQESWFKEAGRHCEDLGDELGDELGEEEERGRSRKRRRRRQRSGHTVDTLPSLTDTSAVGDANVDEMGDSGIR